MTNNHLAQINNEEMLEAEMMKLAQLISIYAPHDGGFHLNIPVISISREEADVHFGFLGVLASLDISSAIPGNAAQTKELLGWKPAHPGLIEDLE